MSDENQDNIQSLNKCLAEMPETGPQLSKRKTVALLASAIQQARDKGYTLKQIAQQLQKNGFDISYATLRNALPRQKKARSRPKKPRAAAKTDPQTPIVTSLSGAAPRERATTVREVAPVKSPPATPDPSPPVVFPPGASCVFTADGCFIPAPDSDDL